VVLLHSPLADEIVRHDQIHNAKIELSVCAIEQLMANASRQMLSSSVWMLYAFLQIPCSSVNITLKKSLRNMLEYYSVRPLIYPHELFGNLD